VALHLVAFVCEFTVVCLTLVTILSRGEDDAPSVIFLIASMLVAIGVAYVNILGARAAMQWLKASAQRVRDEVARAMSVTSGKSGMSGDGQRRSLLGSQEGALEDRAGAEPVAKDVAVSVPAAAGTAADEAAAEPAVWWAADRMQSAGADNAAAPVAVAEAADGRVVLMETDAEGAGSGT
jgi:hypothetical protein